MTLPPRLEALRSYLIEAWHDRAVMLKIVSFAMIGCVNAVIDFSVFSLGYFYFGLPIIAANIIAWCCGVTNSYIMNSQITFARESGRKLRFKDYFAFAATQLGGLVANTTTVFVASFFIPVLLAKVLAIGASFVVDFTLSHLVVFRRRQTPSPGE